MTTEPWEADLLKLVRDGSQEPVIIAAPAKMGKTKQESLRKYASENGWFWSCKLKRPDTLKRHKTFEVAAKKAGDHGFVYSEADQSVKQVFLMVNGQIKGYDTDKQPQGCNTGGFDMREALRSFNII